MRTGFRTVQLLASELTLLFILLLIFVLSVYNSYLYCADSISLKRKMLDRVTLISWIGYFAILYALLQTIILLICDI